MLAILYALGKLAVDLLKSRSRLEAENLLLRHQLNVVFRIAAIPSVTRSICQKLLTLTESTSEREGPLSFLRLSAIQNFKSEEDLTGLAPERGLIPTEAIEREVGQIGQTQKATRELDCRTIVFDPIYRIQPVNFSFV
jgi:hypothetical protein